MQMVSCFKKSQPNQKNSLSLKLKKDNNNPKLKYADAFESPILRQIH